MGAALFVAVCAQSAIIYNGDLNTAVVKKGNNQGGERYYLNTSTDIVNRINNGGDQTNVTVVAANKWMLSSVSKGFVYGDTGGAPGEGGAFVQHPKNDFKGNRRSVFQFAKDNQQTTGSYDIKMDIFLFDDPATNGVLFLQGDLYAWNSGEEGAILDVGGSDDIFGPDVVTLLDHVTFASTNIAVSTWTPVDLGTVNLGYDYYAWRFTVEGARPGDLFAFDNVVVAVPEPGTFGLLSFAGVGLFMARRKRVQKLNQTSSSHATFY